MPDRPAIDRPTTVVDIHSHVFNAEDLPIDGFVKRLSPVPRLLTGLFSVPFDRLTQWVAPGSRERERLLELLSPWSGAGEGGPPPAGDDPPALDVPAEDELGQALADEWRRLGLPVDLSGSRQGKEAGSAVTDEELAEALARAPRDDVYELLAWLEDWDPALGDALAPEGIRDLVDYVRGARRAAARFLHALRLICRHRLAVAAELARTYPEVSLFVPALVDFSATTSDRPRTAIGEQVAIHSLVAKVSIAGRLPGAPAARVFPLVGFDPYREVRETALRDWNPDRGVGNPYVPYASPASTDPADRYRRGIRFEPARARALRPVEGPWERAVPDLTGVRGALDVVRHAVEQGGFVGVKLYPAAGFLPLGNALRFPGTKGEQLDAALRALYGYCEVMDVPILAHAAHSNGFEAEWDGFGGPAGWELALAEFPRLRVCFGHFGHLHGVGIDPADPSVSGWARRFVDLIDAHPHVYADVGNSRLPLSTHHREQLLALLTALLGTGEPDEAQRRRRRRVMYGSDFWMNTLSPDHGGYLHSFREAVTGAFGAVAAEAFMGANALRFLGFDDEAGQPDLANRNRARLVAFHGPMPTPPWVPAPQ